MNSSLVQFWEHFKAQHIYLEEEVSGRENAYRGLSPEALYTTPQDLHAIFASNLVKGTLVDLGCGSGFSALLYGWMYPDRKAFGIEFEAVRLSEGQIYLKENPLSNVFLVHDDLSSGNIPVGDSYFLYFPTGPVLDRILCELYSSQKSFRLIVVESHGDLIPRIEKENWLTLIGEIPLTSPRHYPFVRVYSRNPEVRNTDLIPFSHTFLDHYLIIEGNSESWLGKTLGMEWNRDDTFLLKTPPRTIHWKDVKRLIERSEEIEAYQQAILLWDKGTLTFFTAEKVFRGEVRKIIISPTFKVELSTGEKVEWTQIQKISTGM